jgi:hypothetical protein
MGKSFYTLEAFVQPGGVRESIVFAVIERGQLRKAAEWLFSRDTPSTAYLLCGYGQQVVASVYEDGERVTTVDLLPYVRVEIDGYPPMTFAPGGGDSKDRLHGIEDAETDLLEELSLLGEDNPETAVTLDWPAVAAQLPPLTGDPAEPADELTITSHYTGGEETISVGMTETESGESYEDLDWDSDDLGLG